MPLYDYRCEQCEQIFEVRMSLKEGRRIKRTMSPLRV